MEEADATENVWFLCTYTCLAYKIDNSEYQCIHSYYDMFLFYVKIQILFGTVLIQTY